jgi:hypothetical protein
MICLRNICINTLHKGDIDDDDNDNNNYESNAIPLQALRGPEGSRRLRLPDFKTIGT